MSITISIPKDMGGELRKLPSDTYDAVLQDVYGGMAKSSGKPKVTFKWLIQSEFSGDQDDDYKTTVGENVLDTYSLQENAIWKLNSVYKQVMDENLPHQDFTLEEFVEFIKSNLKGLEFKIDVKDSDDGERSQVDKVLYSPPKRSGKKRR